MKSDLLYNLALLIGLCIVGGYWYLNIYRFEDYFDVPNSLEEVDSYVASDSTYEIYQNQANQKYRTQGLEYVPCPNGYDCDKLSEMALADLSETHIEIDNCAGKECEDNLLLYLERYGIFNVIGDLSESQ